MADPLPTHPWIPAAEIPSMSKRDPSPPRSEDQAPTSASQPAGRSARNRQIRFLVIFILVLGIGFTLISLPAINDSLVVPFTAGIAKVSAGVLDVIGQDVTLDGVQIRNQAFAVEILNGCNGIEAMTIFLAAVLAYPASWKSKAIGLVGGMIAIQIVNLIRVVALFLTGVYWPSFFHSSHTVIWQTVVIAAAVLLWIFWADRLAGPTATPEAA